MALLKLYSSGVALAVWAVSWAAGLRGDTVITVWLALLAVTVVVSERERARRRRARRG